MSSSILRTILAGLAAFAFSGCGKSTDAEAGMARTPEQAASQVEEAFASANAKLKELASAMSESLRKNEYETAVVSLQTIRGAAEVTPEQRLAVYSSALTLEARLISAIEAGDKNAERAYQLLKALKKN
jgi:hypothetical protein